VSILQFLRIFWARRWLIGAATVACVIGAYIVTLILPPRWDATSRVMMGLLKPDPVTGLVIGSSAGAYVTTQMELIKDYAVAGQVADQLGWLSDPRLIDQWQHRPASDQRDFRRWLAQIVIDRTKVKQPEGSNILEISYTATNPNDAKLVADSLRQAYIDTSLAFRRDQATRDADWFESQAAKIKIQLDAAASAQADYERQNGIVMADDKTDLDTARLRSLAGAGAAPAVPFVAPNVGLAPAAIQLAQVDAEIAQAEKTLGPNHPQMLALKASRALLAQQAVQEQAAMKAQASAAASAASGAGAMEQAVQAAKSRVLGESDKLARLNQLASTVNLLKDEYDKTSARAADLRQEAAVADTGLTPLGNAATPRSPSFPNRMLIIPGAFVLGLGVGLLVALLMELFNRRVRGVEDLRSVGDTPLLAVIAGPRKPGRGWINGLRRRFAGQGRRAVAT
jgi:polysaccharide biosynthesis transport protein